MKKSLIWKQKFEYDSLFEFKNKTFTKQIKFVSFTISLSNAFFILKIKV